MKHRHGRALLYTTLSASLLQSSLANFHWPDDDVAPKTPERFRAAKQAARHIGCDLCAVVTAFFVKMESEAFEKVLASGVMAKELANSEKICTMKNIAGALREAELALQPASDGTVRLLQGESSIQPSDNEGDDEDNFHWKAFAVQEGCRKTFGFGGGRAIARSVKEDCGTEAEETCTEESRANAFKKACLSNKACLRQIAERQTTEIVAIRDKNRSQTDPSFLPLDSDMWDRALKYDKMTNYYKVLGAALGAPKSTILASHETLIQLLRPQLDHGVDFTNSMIEQVDFAKKVLTHQPTRRQYDRERIFLDIFSSVSKTERKPDTPSFDGYAALKAGFKKMNEAATKGEL